MVCARRLADNCGILIRVSITPIWAVLYVPGLSRSITWQPTKVPEILTSMAPVISFPRVREILIDPIAAKYILYLPLPNYNVGSSGYNPYTNWVGSPVTSANINSYDIKIDHRFTQRDLLSVKSRRATTPSPLSPVTATITPPIPVLWALPWPRRT